MARINFTMTPGEYVYGEDSHGKYAYGVIRCGATSERNAAAQRAAGGADREANDHGGHLIAHCLGGRNDETNLDAQNANVNQRGQRHIEQRVAELANDPNKTVFMSVENHCSNGSERPDATMITVAVRDNTTGQIDVQDYSLQNASYEEQAEWEALANENTEIDPRQDIGLTPEERALANEYAEFDELDEDLGEGRAFFLDPDTAPITSDQDAVNTNDGAALDDDTALSTSEELDDGASLDNTGYEDNDVSPERIGYEDDGASLDDVGYEDDGGSYDDSGSGYDSGGDGGYDGGADD